MFALILISSLLLSACALVFEAKDQPETETGIKYPNSPRQPDLVEVQFNVTASAKFSDADVLALDVLDLVGGLRNNVERYRITPNESGSSMVTITLPEGATIAYRYSMLEPMQVNEMLANGDELPFRQVLVRKNLIVNDLIAGWPENPYTGELADLNGAIADKQTEEALADVFINVAGHTTMTDMNGRFFLRDIPVGIHNFTAYRIDGSHQTFQQEVNLVESLSTLAIARMIPNPEVILTFVMTPPQEVYGAPIRIAGNLEQFGQSLTDLSIGNGVQAVNMPLLTENTDGTFVTQIKAFAGNVLRYSYTLGDGILGIERNENGYRTVRQFTVPSNDAVITDTVISWRAKAGDPTTFYTQAPTSTAPEDRVYMQFNQGYWSNPIPMWKAQDGSWLLVYYPNLPEPNEVRYRYCRFAQCEIGLEINQTVTERSLIIGTQNEVHDQIGSWWMYDPTEGSEYASITFPKSSLVGIELATDYDSGLIKSYQNLISDLKGTSVNWVILRPSWRVSVVDDLPFIDPHPSLTIPSGLIASIAKQAKENGFKVSIYPKLDYGSLDANWWQDSIKNSLWWQQWYSEYERIITHLIKLGTGIGADHLILGGPDVWQSYPGALETVGQNYGTPRSSEEIWTELLEKTNQYFDGEILMAHAMSGMGTESYSFYEKVDGFYLLIDSDASLGGAYSSQTVGQYLDGVIAAMKEEQDHQLFIGLNGPSYQTASNQDSERSTAMLSPLDEEYGSYNVNINAQTGFYTAYLEAIPARDWIHGVASRGFYPGIKLTDFSSSIYGKPAFQLFHNQ